VFTVRYKKNPYTKQIYNRGGKGIQREQTNIHAPVGFEPTIAAGERAQTNDRAATWNSVHDA
jgi:hypothetical protein